MPAGRPRIKLDEEKLKKCAEKQWTDAELAAFFECSIDTLHRNYADLIDTSRANGKAKLRDLIWQRAIAGSDRMLEHAANRFLGKIAEEIKHDGKIDITITDYRGKKK